MSKREGDHGFAHSMTDLMAGVAVTFLLLAAIFMIQAARANVAARIQGMPRLLLNFALARRLGSLYATFFVSASADAASGRSALTSAFI